MDKTVKTAVAHVVDNFMDSANATKRRYSHRRAVAMLLGFTHNCNRALTVDEIIVALRREAAALGGKNGE